MRLAILALTALALAGCQTTSRNQPLVVNKLVVVDVPPDLLRCARVKYPAVDSLTDRDVAKLIVRMDSLLAECGARMDAIKKFQAEAKSRLEK